MKRQKHASTLCSLLLLGLLLGIHEGKVALWKDEDPIPYKVFPYYATLLPQDAQDALKAGIHIESMEDLEEFLRKYLP